MQHATTKQARRIIRHTRVRARIAGQVECPRISIFRSNRRISVQLIDDTVGKTIVSVDDRDVKILKKDKGRVVRAERVGELLAKKAAEKNITAAVFDRGGYRYHGIVKAIADGARKGGLRF